MARPFLFSPILSPLTTRRVTVEVFDPAPTRVFLILTRATEISQIKHALEDMFANIESDSKVLSGFPWPIKFKEEKQNKSA
jgi:hypothetical protein